MLIAFSSDLDSIAHLPISSRQLYVSVLLLILLKYTFPLKYQTIVACGNVYTNISFKKFTQE